MTTFQNIIAYFRSLAARHNKLKGFLTAEEYELNEHNHVYPMLVFHLPIAAAVVSTRTNSISIDIKLSVLTNIIEDLNGNDVVVLETMLQKEANQIAYGTELAAQDLLVSNALQYMAEICHKALFDSQSDEVIIGGEYLPLVITSFEIETSARQWADDLYAATAKLTIEIEDTYKCSMLDAFSPLI